MEENENKIEEDESKSEEVVNETSNEDTEQSLPNIIDSIRNEYEKKINALTLKYVDDIAERDKIIKDLITGDAQQEGIRPSFIDRLNLKRNYKKW